MEKIMSVGFVELSQGLSILNIASGRFSFFR